MADRTYGSRGVSRPREDDLVGYREGVLDYSEDEVEEGGIQEDQEPGRAGYDDYDEDGELEEDEHGNNEYDDDWEEESTDDDSDE